MPEPHGLSNLPPEQMTAHSGVAVGPDPDFPAVGTVKYELHKGMDQKRCCIKRVEVVAICESREEARQWMLEEIKPEAEMTGSGPYGV